jgi:hypothetical protein
MEWMHRYRTRVLFVDFVGSAVVCKVEMEIKIPMVKRYSWNQSEVERFAVGGGFAAREETADIVYFVEGFLVLRVVAVVSKPETAEIRRSDSVETFEQTGRMARSFC